MQRTSSAPAIPFPLVGPSAGYLPEPSLPPVPRIPAMYKEPSISDFGELGSQGPPQRASDGPPMQQKKQLNATVG